MKKGKHKTDYYKIVNIDEETGEITMLDYVFNHGDGFKGATGTRFEPISKEAYNESTSRENIIEYLIHSGMELPDDHKSHGFEGFANAIINAGEAGEIMFDLSYNEKWDNLRFELGLTKDEAFIFNCIGGGRCFDKNFNGNRNTKLSKIIREYES